MRAVIQRVESAAVSVDGSVVGRIGGGFLVLLGIGGGDTERDCEKLSRKMIDLRIFADSEGKTNLSLKDVGGELLIISQFTLFADCRKGNRPNFLKAKEPAEAQRLYELFCELCGREVPTVERGVFGAEMRVELVNDGPFTIVLECNDGDISS